MSFDKIWSLSEPFWDKMYTLFGSTRKSVLRGQRVNKIQAKSSLATSLEGKSIPSNMAASTNHKVEFDRPGERSPE